MLPDVGSTIVPPIRRRPSRSAASIIEIPMRSLFEPPGFMNSSFARSVAPVSRPKSTRRTTGVEPTRSSTVGYVAAPCARKPIRAAARAAEAGTVSP